MVIHISWYNRLVRSQSVLITTHHLEHRLHCLAILKVEWSLQEQFENVSELNFHESSGSRISTFELWKGRIGEMNEHNKTYIDHLYLMSPEGAHLNFNTSGVLLHG